MHCNLRLFIRNSLLKVILEGLFTHQLSAYFQVRNCVAHDGSRAPIQLVDEKGCVSRPKIMSPFRKVKNFDTTANVLSYAYFQVIRIKNISHLKPTKIILQCSYLELSLHAYIYLIFRRLSFPTPWTCTFNVLFKYVVVPVQSHSVAEVYLGHQRFQDAHHQRRIKMAMEVQRPQQ